MSSFITMQRLTVVWDDQHGGHGITALYVVSGCVCFAGRVDSSHRITRAIKQEIQDLDVPVGRSEGLAVDWLSGNIYWTDAKKHVIEVASKDGYYRYALFSGLVNMPHALVLDPPAG